MSRNSWYGCRRDLRDARDHVFKAVRGSFPMSVDLRQHMPAPQDQGDIGSCVAHSVTAALRFIRIKAGVPDVPLSRLQSYYDYREIEGTVGEDAGGEIRNAIKCAAKIGIAAEDLWPYDADRFCIMPPNEAYTIARPLRGLAYERVPVSMRSLKLALARGFPVVVGLSLYESFESAAVEKTGVVPMPKLKTEGMVGCHAMVCVGYGQRLGYFTVRNSWGADFGVGGNCFIPESYLGSTLYASDFWQVTAAGA